MVAGWCDTTLNPKHLVILDRHPERLSSLQKDYPFTIIASLDDMDVHISPAIICLAVKPKGLESVLLQLGSRFISANPLIMTVIAGKLFSYYESFLWKNAAIVRVMPNTPCSVRDGMSGCIANAAVTETQRSCVNALMQAVGQTLWLKDEDQMHALTAISGSGPAYVFFLMECMIDAALAHGFSEEDARLLVGQTFLGASQMVHRDTAPISQLRNKVTSPGGTTQAGLEVLMDKPLRDIFDETIRAAKERSEALSA